VSTGVIREVDVAVTHDLRRLVLRDGRADADVHYDEDAAADSFHLAALDAEGAVVGVATWAPCPTEHRPGARAWRLRGMAVHPDAQGGGVGSALLAAAIDRLRPLGVEVLWADGRDAALPFYERHGWSVEGEGFLAAHGIPHHVVVLDLGATRP
jgi:GNAT superfamily N-acetyltransferase